MNQAVKSQLMAFFKAGIDQPKGRSSVEPVKLTNADFEKIKVPLIDRSKYRSKSNIPDKILQKGASKAENNAKITGIQPLEHQNLNLDHEYWVKSFLYPFALDPTPIRLQDYPIPGNNVSYLNQDISKLNRQPSSEKVNILDTKRFYFPISHIDNKEEYIDDILQPITIQQDDIIKDMYAYTKEFPIEIIPHITENGEINDLIHNYKRPNKEKPLDFGEQKVEAPRPSDVNGKEAEGMSSSDESPAHPHHKKNAKPLLALEATAPQLKESDIKEALNVITDAETAKLIGLIAHLVYWNVFGHLNSMPLDRYHLKQLFISIVKIMQVYQG